MRRSLGIEQPTDTLFKREAKRNYGIVSDCTTLATSTLNGAHTGGTAMVILEVELGIYLVVFLGQAN